MGTTPVCELPRDPVFVSYDTNSKPSEHVAITGLVLVQALASHGFPFSPPWLQSHAECRTENMHFDIGLERGRSARANRSILPPPRRINNCLRFQYHWQPAIHPIGASSSLPLSYPRCRRFHPVDISSSTSRCLNLPGCPPIPRCFFILIFDYSTIF